MSGSPCTSVNNTIRLFVFCMWPGFVDLTWAFLFSGDVRPTYVL